MRKISRVRTAPLLAALALVLAPTALAHSQTVNPRGQGEPGIVNDPISQRWAQAHCHAQSPAIVAQASGGVVAFSPAGPLPCIPPAAIANPGGQFTGP